MYEKYSNCIFLLIICIGCRANTIDQSAHASNYRPPQLPPVVQEAVERTAEKSSDGDGHYHHQHFYIDGSSPQYHIDETLLLARRNQVAQKRADHIVYKPRVGEILVKDSVMYNGKTPVTRQYSTIQLPLRRNYWPIVDNTVTSLATKAAAGANAVKNLLKVGFLSTFDNVNAAVEHKRQKIKSYLIQAAQEHKFALQQAKEDERYLQQQQLKLASSNGGSGGISGIGGGGGGGGGSNAGSGSNAGGITQQIPLTNQPHHPLLLKSLHHLIPLKQQLTQTVVQHLAKHLKKPRIKKPAPIIVYTSKTKPLPTTTISEDYIHTYDNNYIPPKFFDGGKNPYADMGVTSYKHFEDTILKELEEKEERKVEATIHTILDEKYVTNESAEGTKPGSSQIAEWQPFNANEQQISNDFFTSPQPSLTVGNYIQSTFDRPFNDVRPVCENTDEIAVQPTLFVYPAGAETQLNEQQAASNDNSVTVKPNANHTNSNISTTTEKPNYPAYFIKQQQQLKKLQQKLIGAHRSKPTQTINKTQQRNKYNYKSRNTPSTASKLATTTTIATPTTSSPIITTSALLYYSANGTDDGFQPIIPPNDTRSKMRKTTRNKLNETTTTKPKTSSIQAQASHVSLSIVSAPNSITTNRTQSIGDSKTSTSYTRKAPKKVKTKEATNGTNSTTTSKSNQKTYRGSIKFSDSLHQSP